MKKIIFFLLAFGAGVYLYQQQQITADPAIAPDTNPTTTELIQEETNAQLILTATENDQTAFELVAANAKITTKDYGEAGLFITGINDLESDNEHYWAFYVNDEYAQAGASQTILKNGDTIKFVYEEINAAKF